MSRATHVQLGLGAFGLGSAIIDGAAALEIRPALRHGKVGVIDPNNKFDHDGGVVIKLGSRKSANILLRHIRRARDLLPK